MEERKNGDAGSGRFVYFVIRIRCDAGSRNAEPDGTVERLGSARARTFNSARELLEMLTEAVDCASHGEPIEPSRGANRSVSPGSNSE